MMLVFMRIEIKKRDIATAIKKLQRIWNILNKDEIFYNFPLCKNHKHALNKIFLQKNISFPLLYK